MAEDFLEGDPEAAGLDERTGVRVFFGCDEYAFALCGEVARGMLRGPPSKPLNGRIWGFEDEVYYRGHKSARSQARVDRCVDSAGDAHLMADQCAWSQERVRRVAAVSAQ